MLLCPRSKWTGPLARTAEDLALLMDVISAPAPLESYWALDLPKPTKTSLADYKIAVWGDQSGFPVSEEVRAAVAAVSAALARCGATVDDAARPDFDSAMCHRLYLQLLGCTNTCKEGWCDSPRLSFQDALFNVFVPRELRHPFAILSFNDV